MSVPNPSDRAPSDSLGMENSRRASEGAVFHSVMQEEPGYTHASASPRQTPGHILTADRDIDDYTARMQSLAFQSPSRLTQLQRPSANYHYAVSPYVGDEQFQFLSPIPPHSSYTPYPQQSPIYLQRSPYIPSAPGVMTHYPHFPQFHAPPLHQSNDFPIETMHGMPSYPFRPPVIRSNQTSPLNPSPPYPHQTPSQAPYSRPSTGQTTATYGVGMWSSPPMSPALDHMYHNSMGSMDRAHHPSHPAQLDEFGGMQGVRGTYYASAPLSAWAPPSAPSPYAFYTSHQQQYPVTQGRPGHEVWSAGNPSAPAQMYYPHPGSWISPPLQPGHHQANRIPWSGSSRAVPRTEAESPERGRERKAYHPQPPARRSDWVMWVGNVPNNTSHEELWRYFNSTVPASDPSIDAEMWRGPSSIFLISRSSCAFVNLSSQADLDRAVGFFNGRPLRPWDARCPRMVCRIRRKDDDLRAGVGAQRGTGMHRDWVKTQPLHPLPTPQETLETPDATPEANTPAGSVPPSPAILEHPPEGEGRRRESILKGLHEVPKHKSSAASGASTNSSFLMKNFPKRFFILKSLTTAELEDSVKSCTWKTQRHNEPILDQAFRTSKEGVFLFFGANRSGEFFGYAKMIEPIDKEKAALHVSSKSASNGSSSGSGSGTGLGMSKHKAQSQPERIKEEEEHRGWAGLSPVRLPYFLSPSVPHMTSSSPGELSPREEVSNMRMSRGERKTDPAQLRDRAVDQRLAPAAPRAQTYDPKAGQPSFFPPVPISVVTGSEQETDRQEALGGSARSQEMGDDGVLRKDTALTPGEKKDKETAYGGLDEADEQQEFAPDSWGQAFNIQWIRVGSLPFNRTRHLRNPWNVDREVKVSRDGTEVEPMVGLQLMSEWDKPDVMPMLDGARRPSSPSAPLLAQHRYPAL